MSAVWNPLHVADCDPSPFAQFVKWFDEAKPLMVEREAVALITADKDAHPTGRMVLLRHVDERSFGWYSNYHSRKGRELDENPNAALLWYCESLGRQVRIEGVVEHMSDAQSDAYFNARPKGHQIGAHASHQSELLASREELERRVQELTAFYEDRDVPRPSHWGGFRLTPSFFEFWQHRQDRLHDRVFYTPDGDAWLRSRHSP